MKRILLLTVAVFAGMVAVNLRDSALTC